MLALGPGCGGAAPSAATNPMISAGSGATLAPVGAAGMTSRPDAGTSTVPSAGTHSNGTAGQPNGGTFLEGYERWRPVLLMIKADDMANIQ
jgi:hypothetical protein